MQIQHFFQFSFYLGVLGDFPLTSGYGCHGHPYPVLAGIVHHSSEVVISDLHRSLPPNILHEIHIIPYKNPPTKRSIPQIFNIPCSIFPYFIPCFSIPHSTFPGLSIRRYSSLRYHACSLVISPLTSATLISLWKLQ